MACINGRDYLNDSTATKPVPPVPNDPNDWSSIQRLLQDLQARAHQETLKAGTLQQPARLNTPRTGALPAPENLTASGAGPIALNWSAYAQIYMQAFSFFKLYRSVVNNFDTASIIGVINGTRFVDSNIVVSTTYYYWVTGVTKEGIEGTPATASASFVGFSTTYLADLAVTTAKIADLAIVETKIDNDSISTPKLQALSVIAAKIDVGQLSAISADLGTITAGIITGATIQTASGTGARVVLTSAGLKAYNSSNVVQTEIVNSNGSGSITTSNLYGLSTLVLASFLGFNPCTINLGIAKIEFGVGAVGEVLQIDGTGLNIQTGGGSDGKLQLDGTTIIDGTGVFVGPSINIAGSITVGSGQGITNGAGESITIAANEVQAYVNSVLVGKFDGTSNATNTNFYYYRDGALRQAKVVAGALMEV